MKLDPESNTEIFSTDNGILTVKNPVKRRILSLLSDGEKTGSEIREELDRAKSTISVHLSDLEELGLIEESPCPTDNRKKIFSLRANRFGKSQVPSKEPYEEILKNLRKSAGQSYKFLRSLFHLIRYGFESMGMDMRPALRVMGRDAGKSIAQDLESESMRDLLMEIQTFLKDNELGELLIEDKKELKIINCFDCAELPNIGSTVCTFYEGLFEGMIIEKTDLNITVREVECFAEGKNYCRFNIEIEE